MNRLFHKVIVINVKYSLIIGPFKKLVVGNLLQNGSSWPVFFRVLWDLVNESHWFSLQNKLNCTGSISSLLPRWLVERTDFPVFMSRLWELFILHIGAPVRALPQVLSSGSLLRATIRRQLDSSQGQVEKNVTVLQERQWGGVAGKGPKEVTFEWLAWGESHQCGKGTPSHQVQRIWEENQIWSTEQR